MRTARLKVTMRDVVPAAVRVLDVPAACTLPELHDLLQAGLGWTDSHLHVFDGGDRHYGPASDDDWDDAQLDEAGVTLKALGSSFTYLYDLGDGWEHAVEVLGPGGDTPGCAAGEGACPPEDCGGPHGYAELLATDPAAGVAFRLDERDAAIAQAAGSMPETVRLVLELTCDGVKLTPGGRLPRVIVRAVQEHRPEWYSLRRPASVEEDLYPLLELHGLLRRAGLLTLRGGVLRPAKASADETQVVRRLRAEFMPGAFATVLAELAVAELAARGPAPAEELARRLHPRLGWGWSAAGRPVEVRDVEQELHRLSATLRALDLVRVLDEGPYPWEWTAGPSARTLLPGAALLARLFAA